jgi:hypothetical protein
MLTQLPHELFAESPTARPLGWVLLPGAAWGSAPATGPRRARRRSRP